ncbi:MAG TPA: PQQ-binding-like beta-propeller repeat protein [Kofleriaceae bacterium]|nr:PQQ-binding-like beta-propeller repeat protein [Kofleriaceae bacterium]
MSGRWLVTLALAVVAVPGAAGASAGFRVERQTRAVTTSHELVERAGPPRVARLPASVELDRDAVLVVTERGLRVRHSLGRAHGVSWIATVGPRVVVGYAARPGGHADSIMAIDHVTGRLAWRRTVDSLGAAELAGDLLAVERAGTLDVIDARSGGTVGTTPLRGQGLQAVVRAASGDLHVKTRGDLIAIDRRTGGVRWVQPASAVGNALVAPSDACVPVAAPGSAAAAPRDAATAAAAAALARGGCVIDAWVDRARHRYGLVGYDARTGRRIASIELGDTSGWYELERVEIAPDGPHDVLVSAVFATR